MKAGFKYKISLVWDFVFTNRVFYTTISTKEMCNLTIGLTGKL